MEQLESLLRAAFPNARELVVTDRTGTGDHFQVVVASPRFDGPGRPAYKDIGGLYGVSLGRAFFGESMFHRARDASKVALVHLVARLITGGFELLDTQYVTEHLRSFGAVEVSRRRYTGLLDKAIRGEANFRKLPLDRPISGARALGIIAARG